jgi:hypothetical protein
MVSSVAGNVRAATKHEMARYRQSWCSVPTPQ